MFTMGIPLTLAALTAALAAAGVVALFFLKVRYPERPVPSVMLWRAVRPEARRTVLWRKLSRWLHLLLLLTAVLLVAAALTDPVWVLRETAPVVVVAEIQALPEAALFAAKGNPGRTALIAAGPGPETVRDFHTPDLPLAERPALAGDRSAALLLARARLSGAAGRICYFGALPPPWLPEGGSWIQSGEASPAPETPPWRLYFHDGATPADLPPGMTTADDPAGADLFADSGDWTAIFAGLRELGWFYRDNRQQAAVQATPAAELTPDSGSVRLAGGLWALALLLLALDCWLWQRGRAA